MNHDDGACHLSLTLPVDFSNFVDFQTNVYVLLEHTHANGQLSLCDVYVHLN